MRIIYMGTPEFAIPPLEALLKEGYDIAAVITAADKPAGRGKTLQSSPVKIYAEKLNIKVLQPLSLKNSDFINELNQINPDLQVVVAFRMLPESVWSLPPKGTFNIHASLLPHYRGAAPINHAVINGEKETGLTSFFIDEKIDTGQIIYMEKTMIGEKETAGELHDRLMIMAGSLAVKTVKAIEKGDINTFSQEKLVNPGEELKKAPKIFKEDCKINWNRKTLDVYNFIRGLSPYPTAYATLTGKNGISEVMKIFLADYELVNHNFETGSIISSDNNRINVALKDGLIKISELQMPGKRKMDSASFLRGFKNISEYRFT